MSYDRTPEYLGAIIIGLLIVFLIPAVFAIRFWRITLALLLVLLLASWAWSAQTPEGFVLRGQLDNAAPDGTPYFKIGEAFVFTMPKDSAILPGIRALEGKKVIITLFEDK